ncbi:hypothetical protein ACVWWR_002509 [Bradyrhizobium sp. LM3.2]
MAIWLVVLIPTIEPGELKKSFLRPESFLPAALFALAVLGLLWTDVDRTGMLQGLGPVAKFAVLPLLIYHFPTLAARRVDFHCISCLVFGAHGFILVCLLCTQLEDWGG